MSETKMVEKMRPGEFRSVSDAEFKRMSDIVPVAQTGTVTRLSNINTTGHRVYDKAILVRMDDPLDKIGRIWVPQDAQDKQKLAEVYGTVINVGVNAFSEARREVANQNRDAMEEELLRARMEGREPRPIPLKEFDCPQVGDRVTIARYAGVMLDPKRVGGQHIRMMNDEDIVAIVEE